MNRIIMSAGFLWLVACFHFGPTAETFPLASSPNGATVNAALATGGSVTGELLAVRDDGVVLLRGEKLVLVPYSALRELKVDKLDHYSLSAGTPSPERRASLKVISRYPQGINAQVQQKLFAQSGQTEFEVVR